MWSRRDRPRSSTATISRPSGPSSEASASGPKRRRLRAPWAACFGTPSGERYAITCSHVIQAGASARQPADADVGRGLSDACKTHWVTADDGGLIGACVASTDLAPSLGGCNRYSGSLNTVDAALIAIDSTIPAQLEILEFGPVAGFGARESIDVGTVVDVVGKESGRQRARIGGLGLVYEFLTPGGRFCFDRVIELRHPSRFYGLYGTFTPPVRQGDSALGS